MQDNTTEMTRILADFVADFDLSNIPDSVFEHAKVALMDWLGVTLAGKDDPLVIKLLQYTDLVGGNQQATILGHGVKKSVAQAALVNGSASHALDYDDTLATFLGHPTVTLFPGLLALSEFKNKSGSDFLVAYIVGLKVGTVIASSAGYDHYMSGYHGTATMGCLASAAACSRLLGLDGRKTAYALGIAGTQSAGLKRVFGTMCKPFHAGRAAETGVMSALLAENGFTSAEDILEGPNGLFAAMKGAVNEDVLKTLGQTWAIEDIAQKYHASCHATHSPIEATWSVLDQEGLSVNDVKSINVRSSELALSAAFRKEAHNGLEGKFCIPYCVANALLRGRGNTGLQAFTDERVNDPEIQTFMTKISTALDPEKMALDATVEVETNDGRVFSAYSNILSEIPELQVKQAKIKDKFTDLCQPILGDQKTQKLLDAVSSLQETREMNSMIELM
ncbi:MAG: MmgE/PrpD family protein [Proteobacteria bacterium]|nr:MmgE/PrpD family protein [Pseudomonadota bacterium]